MKKYPDNNLRERRKFLGLTLQQVADRVNEKFDLSTNHDMIRKLETGERELTHTWMIKLSDALRCEIDELIKKRKLATLFIRGEIRSGKIFMYNDLEKEGRATQVKIPPQVEFSDKLYLITTADDSMFPTGWIVGVEGSGNNICDDLTSKIPYAVKVEGQWLIRYVRKGYSPNKYNLHGNTLDIIEDVALEACDKVVFILPR